MLSNLEKTIILKGRKLCETVPAEEIYHIAQVMKELRLDKDIVLFEEGIGGLSLYHRDR